MDLTVSFQQSHEFSTGCPKLSVQPGKQYFHSVNNCHEETILVCDIPVWFILTNTLEICKFAIQMVQLTIIYRHLLRFFRSQWRAPLMQLCDYEVNSFFTCIANGSERFGANIPWFVLITKYVGKLSFVLSWDFCINGP